MRFKIEWTDPETNELKTIVKEFEDTPTVSAKMWAEDWAYTVADKGYHRIIEIKPRT